MRYVVFLLVIIAKLDKKGKAKMKSTEKVQLLNFFQKLETNISYLGALGKVVADEMHDANDLKLIELLTISFWHDQAKNDRKE